MKLTGGSLKVGELMELLKASYLEQPNKTIYGFTLDEKLSNLYGKVYVDMNKKKSCNYISWYIFRKLWFRLGK